MRGLALHLEFIVHGGPELGQATVDMRAAVSLVQQSGWFRLGAAQAERPMEFTAAPVHREARCTLVLDLDDVDLEAVERHRLGDDLRLRLELSVIAVAEGGPGFSGSEQQDVLISAEEWGRLLDRAQTHRQQLLLIPAPDRDTSRSLRDADEHLQTARLALRQGRYRDSIRDVRLGIEVLGIARSAPSGKKVEDRTVPERYATLAQALFTLTSAPSHADRPDPDYAWSRADAVAAIAGLMSLVGWEHARTRNVARD